MFERLVVQSWLVYLSCFWDRERRWEDGLGKDGDWDYDYDYERDSRTYDTDFSK